MVEIDFAAVAFAEAKAKFLPTVITYSRLEPLDLSRGDLSPGLEARIADPLWLIGRQWQFEELRGEDAGSPVIAEMIAEHGSISRFRAGPRRDGQTDAAVDYPSGSLPIEVAVEAESATVLPERVRAALGLHLMRLTRAADLPTSVLESVLKSYTDVWPFTTPAETPLRDADRSGDARRRIYAERIPDAAAVLADLSARLNGDGAVASLPPETDNAAGSDARRAIVRDVATRWLAFASEYIAEPIGASWNPNRLEYAFAAQATLSTGPAVLTADEYTGGIVDWHTFDVSAAPDLGPSTVTPQPIAEELIPTPVRYPGMPSERLWAFEDGAVALVNLEAGATDLARLALVEFALAYGNDWFMIPFELSYGDVARIHTLRVSDTFGVTVDVRPSREATVPGWTVFQHTPVDDASPLADVFVLPATVRHALQGAPLEEVTMFRDEMANLVWGVERVVQGPSGEPVARGLIESRSLRQSIPGDLGDAKIVYRLMTPVPEHWVPFVSVPVPGIPLDRFATELERRPLVHFRRGEAPQLIHPRGTLLRADLSLDISDDLLRIAEEEIPREGILLTRRFQLARTATGGSVLWIGRQKVAGRGEGASGLRFDTALPPDGV
jgi:hypothetical protein